MSAKICFRFKLFIPIIRCFYGVTGQKNIGTVVFFKQCLVGCLENIISNRKLMQHCSMRLDMLFFIGYNLEEELP
uniref:transposase n=1 Tax=Lacinutrix jangbogonensis TaxID=1469557 RepID=UPI0009DE17BC|nr:transposase [Lacinutrix jangbogonensis]